MFQQFPTPREELAKQLKAGGTEILEGDPGCGGWTRDFLDHEKIEVHVLSSDRRWCFLHVTEDAGGNRYHAQSMLDERHLCYLIALLEDALREMQRKPGTSGVWAAVQATARGS